MTSESEPLVFDPYDYRAHDDPYPLYRRLRNEAPLYRNDERHFWALSRHADVQQGFRNSDALSNANGISLDKSAFGPHAQRTMSFLAMDDPDHLRLRTLVSKGFTPRRIRELEPQVVELAQGHLDTALNGGDGAKLDFIGAFAGKLPMDVISKMVGVPAPDRDHVRTLADAVMHREDGVADVPASAFSASAELSEYFSDIVRQRRQKPTDDLTSALLQAETAGDRLTHREIVAFMFLMVIAGNETTTKLLGNAVYWGFKHPGQLAKVYADPSLIPQWVEETLRYDTSSQILARTVGRDLTLHNTTVPAGDILLLIPASGNRDETVFPDADSYRIGRDIGPRLLSFGSGAHFCLGAHLARMEATVALREFVTRIRDYEIDETAAERVHSSSVRGFASLPLTVRAT